MAFGDVEVQRRQYGFYGFLFLDVQGMLQSSFVPVQFIIDRLLMPGDIMCGGEFLKIGLGFLPGLKEKNGGFCGLAFSFEFHALGAELYNFVVLIKFQWCDGFGDLLSR